MRRGPKFKVGNTVRWRHYGVWPYDDEHRAGVVVAIQYDGTKYKYLVEVPPWTVKHGVENRCWIGEAALEKVWL